MAETFGQLVRRYRKARRLTQERLAELADIDQSTVSQVELDKGDRTVRIVTNLANVFGREPLDWLGLAGVVTLPEVPEATGDKAFDPRAIVAFVESKPDPEFQAKLARQKARRSPESYARLCLRINRAWSSNADLVMDELEAAELDA